jgi:hypothetical protein
VVHESPRGYTVHEPEDGCSAVCRYIVARTTTTITVDNTDAEYIAEALNAAIDKATDAAEAVDDPAAEMAHFARAHRLRMLRNALVEAATTPEHETVTVR